VECLPSFGAFEKAMFHEMREAMFIAKLIPAAGTNHKTTVGHFS
jgi:hypothetical protein